jgi:hypothetical protein
VVASLGPLTQGQRDALGRLLRRPVRPAGGVYERVYGRRAVLEVIIRGKRGGGKAEGKTSVSFTSGLDLARSDRYMAGRSPVDGECIKGAWPAGRP